MTAGQELRIPPLDNEKAVKSEDFISKSDADFIKSIVIYKDENIIAINKPSGLAVQGGTKNNEKPKLVHRIDKDTSGILLLARNRKFADILTKAFREHTLQKTYLALVRGCPDKFEGTINLALEKAGERMIVTKGGQKAVTEYKVLDNAAKKYALIEAKPLTGRTHQIRAHLEALGIPILGDDKYFGANRLRLNEVADKLYLHSYKIDLSGIYNKKMIIKADLPKHFAEACEFFGLEIN